MADKYTSIKDLFSNRFLNFYHMDALTDSGRAFDYFFVSRNNKENIKAVTGRTFAEGCVIYPILKSDPGKIILIRQYRYPLGRFIYELPAGLIEADETPEQAAIRELKEETGYTLEPVSGDPVWNRGFYMGAGYTDESSAAVFGYAVGDNIISAAEDTESISVVIADKAEVRRILSEEQVSLRMAYLCMNFLRSDESDPFRFIKVQE
ncbi:MAG: NUDIX hydrolase [Lachnospiraceae bacterium]|nr:NUDIX hydrolase [Lachnospiraceae bacterium]